MSRKSQLSAEDRQWCIDHFHEFTHREMADRFGVSIETVRNMLHKAGCRRTKEETHRFRASALREDRGFPLIPKTRILYFLLFLLRGGVREDRTPLFLQTYRHSFHRFFKV